VQLDSQGALGAKLCPWAPLYDMELAGGCVFAAAPCYLEATTR